MLNSDLEALLITGANLATANRAYQIAEVSSNVAWSDIGMDILANKFTDSLVTQFSIDFSPFIFHNAKEDIF